jgi:hypothetical protein
MLQAACAGVNAQRESKIELLCVVGIVLSNKLCSYSQGLAFFLALWLATSGWFSISLATAKKLL